MFAAVVAPTVFQTLKPEPAGRLLRAVFPRLYLLCASLTAVGIVGFAAAQIYVGAGIMAVMVSLYLYSRGPLTDKINAARDAELAGEPGAKTTFDNLHKLSVRIFSAQLLVLVASALYWAP